MYYTSFSARLGALQGLFLRFCAINLLVLVNFGDYLVVSVVNVLRMCLFNPLQLYSFQVRFKDMVLRHIQYTTVNALW